MGFFIVLSANLSWKPLQAITILTLFFVFFQTPRHLQSSLRRVSWLLIAMFVIFSWDTPGVYILKAWYAPTIEGIYAESEYALRLYPKAAEVEMMTLSLIDK